MRTRLMCGALAALLGSCSSVPTELVIVVRTDLAVPSELDHVRVLITTSTGRAVPVEIPLTSSSAREQPPAFPLTIGFVRSAGVHDVRVTGMRSSAAFVEQARQVTIPEGERTVLEVFLGRSCVNLYQACEPGLTCAGGTCVSVLATPMSWSGPPQADSGVAPPDASELFDAARPDASELLDGGVDSSLPPTDAGLDAATGTDSGQCNPADCDDGDPCTTDTCGEFGCENTPPGSCLPCGPQGGCPSDETGPWGDCVIPDACVGRGERSRTLTSYSCEGGVCRPASSTESDSCGPGPLPNESQCINEQGERSVCVPYFGEAGSHICEPWGLDFQIFRDVYCVAGACSGEDIDDDFDECGRDPVGDSCVGCGAPDCRCNATGGCEAGASDGFLVTVSTYHSDGMATLSCSDPPGTTCSATALNSCTLQCKPSSTISVSCTSEQNIDVDIDGHVGAHDFSCDETPGSPNRTDCTMTTNQHVVIYCYDD